MLNHGCSTNHQCSTLVSSIHNLLKFNWNVEVIHCYREANKVADRLTNHAHSLDCKEEGFKVYQAPPQCSRQEVLCDLREVCFPRFCAEWLV